jgi:replication factor C large subunit
LNPEKYINKPVIVHIMAMPWVHKYQPKKISEIVGQKEALDDIDNFVTNFKKQKKRSVLAYGPSGSGKTISVYAVAEKHGYEVIEVNASEFRNKDQINQKVGGALQQQSLFSKGKIVLVDEVEGLSGTKDRGGLSAIIALIKKAAFPVVLTCQNAWNQKFSTLRSNSNLVKFNELDYADIYTFLADICNKEKVKFDELALKGLARRCGGDMRAAINDLQSLAEIGSKVTKEEVDSLSERFKIETMPSALVKVFKNSDPEIALSAFNNVEEDFDKRFLWLDENLPKEYTNPADLARAYAMLSKADVFKGRIRRWQHWRFLVYVNALMTAGIATSKDLKYKEFIQYKPTTRIFKLWRAKMKYQKRKAIAQKIAEHTHTSAKRVISSTLPYFQVIFKKDKKVSDQLAEELGLDKEEVAWLRK